MKEREWEASVEQLGRGEREQVRKQEPKQEATVFSEVQRCTAWWFWVVTIGMICSALANFVFWLLRGVGLDNVPLNTVLWIVFSLILVMVAVPLTMLKLTTRITDIAIHVRLSPVPLGMMHPNRFAWGSVRRAYVREYHEFREYGSFGIRYAKPSIGDAISMNGKWGLQLELFGGQKMLISTRKPEELRAALAELKAKGLTVTFE